MGQRASDEEIQLRAYALYLQRGEAPGGANEDWFRAERELRAAGRDGQATTTNDTDHMDGLGLDVNAMEHGQGRRAETSSSRQTNGSGRHARRA